MLPQQRPEAPVNASWFDGRWRLEARADGHLCAATAVPPIEVGVVARSAVRLGEYLAMVVDSWVPGEPATPMFHSEWRDVAGTASPSSRASGRGKAREPGISRLSGECGTRHVLGVSGPLVDGRQERPFPSPP